MGTLPVTTGVEAPVSRLSLSSVLIVSCLCPHPLKVGTAWVTERTYAVVQAEDHATASTGATYAYGRSLQPGPRQSSSEVVSQSDLIGADSATPERGEERRSGGSVLAVRRARTRPGRHKRTWIWHSGILQGKRFGNKLSPNPLGRRSDAALVSGVAGYTKGDGDHP